MDYTLKFYLHEILLQNSFLMVDRVDLIWTSITIVLVIFGIFSLSQIFYVFFFPFVYIQVSTQEKTYYISIIL